MNIDNDLRIMEAMVKDSSRQVVGFNSKAILPVAQKAFKEGFDYKEEVLADGLNDNWNAIHKELEIEAESIQDGIHVVIKNFKASEPRVSRGKLDIKPLLKASAAMLNLMFSAGAFNATIEAKDIGDGQ